MPLQVSPAAVYSRFMQHPRSILQPELLATIREYTQVTEAEGQLPEAILELIRKNRWFQLLVPESSGGLEFPLPEVVRIFEALAWAEANTGWCVNLGAGANMFAGYLDADISRTLFNNPATCCAGSGAISGKARRTPGGYILNGRWKYASGANHATHFTANAWLLDEDGAALTENGQPVFRSFIIPAAEIINYRNWNAIGLKASSSNDFEAENIFTPETHVFTLLRPSAFANGPLYRFPFTQLAVVNMSCMITGIALHFIDLYRELAAAKQPLHGDTVLADNARASAIVQTVTGHFNAARDLMYEQLQRTWDAYALNGSATEEDLQSLTAAAKKASEAAREVLNGLYPLFGMSILDPQSVYNKVWRDGMTASQHYLLSPLY